MFRICGRLAANVTFAAMFDIQPQAAEFLQPAAGGVPVGALQLHADFPRRPGKLQESNNGGVFVVHIRICHFCPVSYRLCLFVAIQ